MNNIKIQKLLAGETIISREAGNSMLPILKSKQAVRLAPITWEACQVGDMVYCKVRGNVFTHLVKGKNEKRGLLIGNNHGHINGWTKQVYGKVIEILKD
ncbi:Phage repressor protein [Flavobacterium sp. 9AF]|uniref:phage repressor protein n=1 Tax=Flavobacterium sp. 9AF TaxID=2653142 RepID=UPI0012EFD238|nr:phage repressor protein [Flavobacterium sp. 9AF]VXB84808.1 Phage repressor protein [Flavobacterium sp. 9AF]